MGLHGEEAMQKLRAIAAGGCAMIVIGDVPVGKRGFFSLHSRKGFAHYQQLCSELHKEGCLVCAQLHQSDSNFKWMIKYLTQMVGKKLRLTGCRHC